MRAAVLHFAFEGVGAREAVSGYVEHNPQSKGVSRKLGYEVMGSHAVPVEVVELPPLLTQFDA